MIKFRPRVDPVCNLRPVRLGIPACVAAGQPQAGVSIWVVREKHEGEYSSVRGRRFPDYRPRIRHAADRDAADRASTAL